MTIQDDDAKAAREFVKDAIEALERELPGELWGTRRGLYITLGLLCGRTWESAQGYANTVCPRLTE